MAQGFNLTAQLQLQAPTNTRQVAQQVRKQLQPLGVVNVKLKADSRAASQVTKNLQGIDKSAKQAQKSVNQLSRSIVEGVRRFGVVSSVGALFFGVTRAIKESTKAAVEFEREVIKIRQVTGGTSQAFRDIRKEVTALSTSLGTSSADLISVSRTLKQAGLSADAVRKSLRVLAQTSLGATFDDIKDTTEGAVAALQQFGKVARQTGTEAQFLTRSLDAISAVSKKFAVESGDLVTAIQKTGGVFSETGGSVEQLIALFTSVRATTRESADTIATGLRTITTRLQRLETVQALEKLGIQLRDARGEFVGNFEAIRRLSTGLAGLSKQSQTYANIIEQLGGFRQVGKVIPLIGQFATAQRALAVAQNATGQSAIDAQLAQQGLGVQIAKVREEFNELVRSITQDSGFRNLVKQALDIASAFIKVADSIKELLPLFTGLAAAAVVPSFGKIFSGFGRGNAISPVTKNQGGPIRRFARGGVVPGTGNRDTVPAMLTPGEFVIKKSSAKKLGAGTLQAMNQNRYALGGKVGAIALNPIGGESSGKGKVSIADIKGTLFKNNQLKGDTSGNSKIFAPVKSDNSVGFQAAIKPDFAEKGKRPFRERFDRLIKRIAFGGKSSQNFNVIGAAFPSTKKSESSTEDKIKDRLRGAFSEIIPQAASDLKATLPASAGVKTGKFNKNIVKQIGIEDATGKIFEGAVTSFGTPFSGVGKDQDDFDFPRGIGSNLAKFKPFAGLASIATDAKKTLSKKELDGIANRKTKNFLSSEVNQSSAFQQLKKKALSTPKSSTRAAGSKGLRRNSGGSIPGSSDTVPALLTPGEFVVNKSAAQSIGYSNLSKMNKTGVQGFNKGGPVGIQRFAGGGKAGTAEIGVGLLLLLPLLQQQLPDAIGAAVTQLGTFAFLIPAASAAVKAFSGTLLASSSSTLKGFGSNIKGAATSIAGGATLAVAGLTIFGSLLKRQAAEQEKIYDRANKAIAKNEDVTTNVAIAQEAAAKKISKSARGGALTSSTTLIAGGLAGAGAGAVAGTAFGPVIGTAIGALAGFTTGVIAAIAQVELEAETRRQQIASIKEVIQESANLASAQGEYANSIKQIDEEGKKLAATFAASGQEGSDAQKKAEAKLAERQANALQKFTQIALSEDVSESSSVVARAVESTGLSRSQLGGLEEDELESKLRGTGIAASQLIASLQAISLSTEALQTAQNENLTALQKQATEGFAAGKTFEQLKAEGGVFAQTLQNAKDATTALINQQIAITKEEIKRLKATNSEANQGQIDRLTNQLGQLEEQARTAGDELEEGYRKASEVAEENRKQIEAENAARQRLIASIERQVAAQEESKEGLEKTQQERRNIANRRKVAAGGAPDLGFVSPDLTGSTGRSQRQLSRFDRVIAPLSPERQASLRETRDEFFERRKVIDEAKTFAQGLDKEQANKIANEGKLPPQLKALADTGLITPGEILKLLKDGLSPEEISKILKPLEEANQANAKTINSVYAEANERIKRNSDLIKEEQEIKLRSIKAQEKYNNVLDRNRALLGGGTGAELLRSDVRAQQTLNARAGLRGGRQLVAGDVQGLQNQRAAALVARADVLRRLKSDPENENLQRRLVELQATISDIDGEFDRLANDTTKKLQLAQEKAAEAANAASQKFSVISDFVIGGAEQRDAILQSIGGVGAAIRTGTLQNQTPEQRSATVGLLDKLSDVVIGTTGLTGKQVKQQLIFQDAVKLGFPKQVAADIATALNTEEKMLQEMRAQTEFLQILARAQGVQGFATGGVVYQNNGGSIFKPRGTDTVPAMLTPGEFVIKRSAVNQIGVGNLEALNSGQGTVYRQGGGVVPGRVYSQTFRNAVSQGSKGDFRKAAKAAGLDGPYAAQLAAAVKKGEAGKFFAGGELDAIERYLDLVSNANKLGYFNYIGADAQQINSIIKPEEIANLQRALNIYREKFKGADNGKFINSLVKQVTGTDLVSLSDTLDSTLGTYVASGGTAFGDPPKAPANDPASKKGAQAAAAERLKQARKDKLSKRGDGARPGRADIITKTDQQVNDLQYELDLITEDGRIEIEDITDKKQRGKAKKLKQQIDSLKKSNNARRKKIIEAGERAIARRKAGELPFLLDSSETTTDPTTTTTTTAPAAAAPAAPAADEPFYFNTEEKVRQQTEADLQRIYGELDASGVRRRDQARRTSLSNRTQLGTAQETLDEVGRKRTAELQAVGLNISPEELDYLQIPKREEKPTGTGGGVGLDYYDRPSNYRAAGGSIPGGNDRVPAMLTPGEFVMSPEAVNRYGVGYMQSLNRGRIPGFRRGGLIGKGDVQYRQTGGGILGAAASILSLDTNGIQGVLESFNSGFSTVLDSVVSQFSSFSGAVSSLAQAFAGGLNVNHQFSGDMTLAFKIENGDQLKQTIAEYITPKISQIIAETIDAKLDTTKNFSSNPGANGGG